MVLSRIRTYGELVMFSHTLFSIPFGLIVMLLAAEGFPSFRLTLWIFIALISARTAANALNRLVDKDIDAINPRTAGRHMPQGLVNTKEVLLLILVCFALLTLSAFMINPLCVVLLPVPIFLFIVYSFTKRFTWACHIILGAACACAPVGAWIAVTGNISWVSLIFGAIVTLWVSGFDIIYGAQDIDFDREENLHSIPSAFGVRNALIISALFHVAAVLLLVYAGTLARLGWIYFSGVCIAAVLLLYEHAIVSPTNLKNVTIASYSVNQVVSTVLLVFSSADILIK
jgi:4-hydroxybenzoate polyprenyltransferase